MLRGEIWTAAAGGQFTGKPRPVRIMQDDLANGEHSSIAALLISTERTGAGYFHVEIEPSAENGLEEVSEVQVDRPFAFRRTGMRERVGVLSVLDLRRVEQAMRRWFDL